MFEQFYGLSGKPFQLTPDASFYFESATHRKALSYLGYGLSQGEGFIVITGEVGSGKSTLVAHLKSRINPEQLTLCEVVTSALDEDEIIHVVAQNFGLEIEGHDKASALGAIEGFLHDEARAGRRCLLVVDEAQNLSISALEELRMLSNFQLGSHPLLQTLLLGQPEFRQTLQGSAELEQLRQRVIATHHLEPMTADEIEPYLEHRLKKVGWAGRPSLDQSMFETLFEATGGIPRKVNQVANRLLLLGAVEQVDEITTTMLQSVVTEMDGYGEAEDAIVEEAEQPAEQVVAAEPKTPAVEAPPAPAGIAPEVVEAMLAQRDAQIAELQQAVIELANAQDEGRADVVAPEIEAMQQKIAEFEARMIEQERTIRQTLTTLIEVIEGEFDQQVAA
jgi:putative secretion ATPase (PEP-CTERM system associated)